MDWDKPGEIGDGFRSLICKFGVSDGCDVPANWVIVTELAHRVYSELSAILEPGTLLHDLPLFIILPKLLGQRIAQSPFLTKMSTFNHR